MSLTWPVSLPQAPKVNGWQNMTVDNVIRTTTAQGMKRRRRRSTGVVEVFLVTLPPMTATQLVDFKTFFNTTTAGGSLKFDWLDFSRGRGVAATFYFGDSPPTTTALTPSSTTQDAYFEVAFQLEMQP